MFWPACALFLYVTASNAVHIEFSVLSPTLSPTSPKTVTLLKNSHIGILVGCSGRTPTEWIRDGGGQRSLKRNKISASNIWTQWTGPETTPYPGEERVGVGHAETAMNTTYSTWLRVEYETLVEEERLVCRSASAGPGGDVLEKVVVTLKPAPDLKSVELTQDSSGGGAQAEKGFDDLRTDPGRPDADRCRVQFEMIPLTVTLAPDGEATGGAGGAPIPCRTKKPFPVDPKKALFTCNAAFYCADNYHATRTTATVIPNSCMSVAKSVSTQAELPSPFGDFFEPVGPWELVRRKANRKTGAFFCGIGTEEGVSQAGRAGQESFFGSRPFLHPRQFTMHEISMSDDVVWLETEPKISLVHTSNMTQTLQARCFASKYPFASHRQLTVTFLNGTNTQVIAFDDDFRALELDPDLYASKNLTINFAQHGPGDYTLECVSVPWNSWNSGDGYNATLTIQVRQAGLDLFTVHESRASKEGTFNVFLTSVIAYIHHLFA